MDKITNKKNNILRICAGNDFSIVVQITEYDTEAGAWVNYDLSAVSDVHMSLIAENGKHIKLPVTVNSDGTVSAAIQSAYLQRTTYGIEITWLTDSLNRRTYSPCLLQIVTSTAESSSNIAEYESNDAYHFNIQMKADVAILSIGKISDEYITQSELADELSNYATNSSVDTQISTLWNDANDTFVDSDELATSLQDYVTNSSLESTLSYYDTSDEVTQKISDAIHGIPQPDLGNYVTKPYLSEQSYVTSSELTNASYVTSSSLDIALSSYVNGAEYDSTNHNILLKNDNTTIDTIDASPFIIDGMVEDVEISNGNLVISFNTDAGKQDITIPISDIFDASNYYTSSQIDGMLTNYASQSDMTTVQGDITSLDGRVTTLENNPSVPTDYVSYTYLADNYISYIELDNYTETISTVLLNDRRDIFNTYSYFNNYYDKSQSDSKYVTSSQVSARYVDYDSLNNLAYGTSSALNDLNDRVTTIEQGGGSSSGVSEEDWDNSNEAIAQELLDNRLDHQRFSNSFSNYYTKTESDGRYATQSWANDKFVTQSDDLNRQQAIAAAFASSVQSTTVHNIWTGSQNDYDAITTKDTNTLYVIL